MFPTTLTFANPVLGTFNRTVGVDAVWIRCGKFATPLTTIIREYARQLAKLQVSINVNLDNNRIVHVFTAIDDGAAQNIRKLVDDVSQGKSAVIVQDGILDENDKLPVYSTASEYLVDKYIQDQRTVVNNFLTRLGVDCSGANIIKKERNLTSEVESNNQEIAVNRAYYLEPLREAVEEANRLFGCNLSVDIRKPIKSEELEVEENNELQ